MGCWQELPPGSVARRPLAARPFFALDVSTGRPFGPGGRARGIPRAAPFPTARAPRTSS